MQAYSTLFLLIALSPCARCTREAQTWRLWRVSCARQSPGEPGQADFRTGTCRERPHIKAPRSGSGRVLDFTNALRSDRAGDDLLLGSRLYSIVAILLLMEAGRQVRNSVANQESENSLGGSGTVEAAVFGLMGLLIAFTFYGAETRFETRRSLIVDEANAIATAYLRLDLLPRKRATGIARDFPGIRPLPAGDLSRRSPTGKRWTR